MQLHEALAYVQTAWRQLLPRGLHIEPTEVESFWLLSLAARASHLHSRLEEEFGERPRLERLIREGLVWHVRVEGPLWRRIGLLSQDEEYRPTLPSQEEMEEAKLSPENWARFYEEYLPAVVIAMRRGLPEFASLAALFNNPPYVRTPIGWISPKRAFLRIGESFHVPGPKPRALLALCRSIIRALLPPLQIGSQVIDLALWAARVLVRREERLAPELRALKESEEYTLG